MKYTMMGFSQREAINLELDMVDLSLLRWFVDFRGARKNGRGVMASRTINGEIMFWVKYEAIIDDMPILKLNSKDSVYRRLKELAKKGILKHATVREAGTFSYYSLGDNYHRLIGEESTEKEVFDNDVKEFAGIIEKFEKNICMLKPTAKKSFIDILRSYDLAFVDGVIELCSSKGSSFRYFEKTFIEKIENGVDTIQKLDADIIRFKKEQETKKIAALKDKQDSKVNPKAADDYIKSVQDKKITETEISEKENIEKVKAVIKPQISDLSYKTWIDPLKFISSNQVVTIVVQNEFVSNIVAKKYESYIIKALKGLDIKYTNIEYKIQE